MKKYFVVFCILFATSACAQTQKGTPCFGTNTATCSCTLTNVQAGWHIKLFGATHSGSVVSSVVSDANDVITQDPNSPQNNAGEGMAFVYDIPQANTFAGTEKFTLTLTSQANSIFWSCSAWANLGGLDSSTGRSFSSTTTPSAGSVTTTQAGDTLFAVLGQYPATDSVSTTNGWTILDCDSTVSARGCSAFKVASSAAAYSDGWALGFANSGAAILTASKQSSPPATAVIQLLWNDGTSVAGTATLFLEGTQETKVDSKALDSTGTVSTNAALDPTQSYKLSVADPTGVSLGEELSAPMPQSVSSSILSLLSGNKFVVTLNKTDHSVVSAKLTPR